MSHPDFTHASMMGNLQVLLNVTLLRVPEDTQIGEVSISPNLQNLGPFLPMEGKYISLAFVDYLRQKYDLEPDVEHAITFDMKSDAKAFFCDIFEDATDKHAFVFLFKHGNTLTFKLTEN